MQWELVKVGRRIRALREELGWSVEWLSAQTGLPVGQIQVMEAGQIDYSANHLVTVMQTLQDQPELVRSWTKNM